MPKAGEAFLDSATVGARSFVIAVEHDGVLATGVTLSEKQAAWGNDQIAQAGLAGRAKSFVSTIATFRAASFTRLPSLEMVEHVGIKHLEAFYKQVHDLLDDQGLFYMQ